MRGDRIFVDTNILVYGYDLDAGEKHQTALSIVKDLWLSNRGVISVQVLQEFFVITTGKIPSPLSTSVAKDILKKISKWQVVVSDVTSVISAIEIQEGYGFSFWDSLIVSSAIEGGAKTLLTEDISDGQVVKGVTIKNPFKKTGDW